MAKKAMIAPRTAPVDVQLAEVLHLYGKGRAYTIIRRHKNKIKIMFEGDLHPMVFSFAERSPAFTKERDPE